MALSPATLRLDLKCGRGAISPGEKCHKGPTSKPNAVTKTLLTAGAIGLGMGLAKAVSRRPMGRVTAGSPPPSKSPSPSSAPGALTTTPRVTPVQVTILPPSPPRLRGSSPKGLLPPSPPRQSKTARMRANTGAAMRVAEQRVAQTAREEVRRIGQIGNTMAAVGEATGMATKTTLRELRLRTEAARRRFEPGYRRSPAFRPPAQLPEGGTSAFQPPAAQLNPLSPEAISIDPRTGQPRRRRAQGFGRQDGPSTEYYRSHPEARRKKVATQAAINRRPEERKRRTRLSQERRQRGIDGKGGRDVSHTESGSTVLEDPSTNRARNGHGKQPRLKSDTWAAGFDADDGKKYSKTVTNPKTGRKNKVRYGAKGYKIAPGTDKGDRYCARSFGDMKSHSKDCSGPDRNTPLCLSRAKWKCSGKTSRRGDAGKVLGLVTLDAPEGGKGKPCGASHIPKQRKCSKGPGRLTPSVVRTTGVAALAAGAITGAALLARRRRKPLSMEEWRKSPENPRNNPKLSPETAQRIANEAVAGGQKWDVQEKINARRQAELAAICATGLGQIQPPVKFDAMVRRPRCQAGEGAFGTYFVHTTGKYGVKLFRDPDVDPDWEFERMGKARAAGVNTPEPLAMNAVRDSDGDVRVQTMVLSHMQGYRTADDAYPAAYGTLDNAPRIIQVKALREFRKLHVEGLAHGDIHSGNVMVHERSRKVALIDFGYATELDDPRHPIHYRDGVQNLIGDLYRLPEFVGFDRSSASDFVDRHKGVIDNIQDQAENYSKNWERFELGVNRYHDALERELLWDERMPRSRFISSADQPRIPDLTRRHLTAHANTAQRQLMEEVIAQHPDPAAMLKMGAEALKAGVKPARLFLALKPERDARLARLRQQPLGTPFPVPAPTPKPNGTRTRAWLRAGVDANRTPLRSSDVEQQLGTFFRR